MKNVQFKVGDLVLFPEDNGCYENDDYGIVTDVEDWGKDLVDDGNSDSDGLQEAEQFIRVHWAHHKNSGDQCYLNVSLKKVEA